MVMYCLFYIVTKLIQYSQFILKKGYLQLYLMGYILYKKIFEKILYELGGEASLQYDREIISRLNRIEGQIRGIVKMMDQEKELRDVLSQLKAARNAIDRTTARIVIQHLEQNIRKEMAVEDDSKQHVEEAVQLLMKTR